MGLDWLKPTPTPTPTPTSAEIKIAIDQTEFLIAQENLREAKANADISVAELLRIQTSIRPSRNFPISLKHDGMQWVCRLVSGEEPRNDLVGGGECPEAAMVNFDLAWYGIQKD
jgi:hypothetical protein